MTGPGTSDDIHRTAKAHGDMLDAARSGDVARYRHAVIEHYQPLQRVLATAEDARD